MGGALPGAGGDLGAGGGIGGSLGGASPGDGGAAQGGFAGSVPVSGGAGGEGSAGSGSGFDAGSDPVRNRVQPGAVCERLATIQCAGEAACCTNPGRTFEQCKLEMKEGCTNELYLDDITNNTVSGYSVDAAEAAFNTFEQMASVCDPTVATWAASPTGLRGITRGTLPSGADCTPPSILNRRVAAGYLASCTNGSACLPTLIGDWSCNPPGPAGSACFTDLNCQDNLYCDNPDFTPSSSDRCTARQPTGTPCSLPNQCLTLQCRGGQCVDADQQSAYCLSQ